MVGKRVVAAVLLVLGAVILLSACKEEEAPTSSERVFYTVRFEGAAVEPIRIAAGSKINAPSVPMLADHVFTGWLNGSTEWVFGWNTVNSDITLVARWVVATKVFDFVPDEVGNTATLTKYKGDTAQINLPETIAGYRISALGEELFKNLVNEDEHSYTVNVPAGITKIGKKAFEGLAGVKINIEGALTEIGEAAFLGCDKLSEITLGEGLKIIPIDGFRGCTGLNYVTFPKTLEIIGEDAFHGCAQLEYIIAHKALVTVGDGAFEECGKLEEIYYTGSAEDFEKIEVLGINNDFKAARVYYYSETKPGTGGNAWYYDSKGKIKFW